MACVRIIFRAKPSKAGNFRPVYHHQPPNTKHPVAMLSIRSAGLSLLRSAHRPDRSRMDGRRALPPIHRIEVRLPVADVRHERRHAAHLADLNERQDGGKIQERAPGGRPRVGRAGECKVQGRVIRRVERSGARSSPSSSSLSSSSSSEEKR